MNAVAANVAALLGAKFVSFQFSYFPSEKRGVKRKCDDKA